MDWYTIAKLIDKDEWEAGKEDEDTFIQCSYCNRWATHPTADVVTEDYTWKTVDQLEPDERLDAERAIKSFNEEGYQSDVGISHSICNDCAEKMFGVKLPSGSMA